MCQVAGKFYLKKSLLRKGGGVTKLIDYVALIFWLVIITPNLFFLKRKDIIGIGDYILLNVLSLIGCEFLWLYLLYNLVINQHLIKEVKDSETDGQKNASS